MFGRLCRMCRGEEQEVSSVVDLEIGQEDVTEKAEVLGPDKAKPAAEEKEEEEKFVAKDLTADLPPPPDTELLPSTFVPDLAIHALELRKLENEVPICEWVEGVLMFADVSGFTALTEKYSFSGTKGISEFLRTLNGYMGSISAKVIEAGGDIVKFAGDAFICLWIIRPLDLRMESMLRKVINCCIEIQDTCGEYMTSMGVKLRVKLGIATGNTKICFIGIKNVFMHYVVVGPGVTAVHYSQEMCTAGDIIVDPQAWDLIVKDNTAEYYNYTYKKDYIKVLNRKKKELLPGEDDFDFYNEVEYRRINREKSVLRTCPVEALKQVAVFLMPELQQIDSFQQLEYLSEMRQCTMVFISLPEVNVEEDQVIAKAFSTIYNAVVSQEGVLNKAVMFDKGCTFLAVFGLPGHKHKNEGAHALKSAGRVLKELKAVGIQCRIGVTTGTTFCGIVGHPHRQEYTVIGRKVNMAARLMCNYLNISCDDETYFHCRFELGEQSFAKLELKELKGMSNITAVYEYKYEMMRASADPIQKYGHPLLSLKREKVMMLREFRRAFGEGDLLRGQNLIIVEGDGGFGKSRVIHWCTLECQDMGYSVVSCQSSMSLTDMQYSIACQMIKDLLGLDKKETDEKERILAMLLDPSQYALSLLNDYLNTDFKSNEVPVPSETKAKDSLTHSMLVTLFDKCADNKKIMVAIDDANYMDEKSWSVLATAADRHSIMCVLSLTPIMDLKNISSVIQAVLSRKILKIKLQILKPCFTTVLTCQFLNVGAINIKIEELLKKHGKGNAQWIKDLLDFLLEKDYVQVVLSKNVDPMILEEMFRCPYTTYLNIEPFEELMRQEEFKQGESISPYRFRVLDIVKGCDLNEVKVPSSVQDMILQKLNTLKAQDLFLLKRISCFGIRFNRYVLLAIAKDLTPNELGNGIKRLMEAKFLECGAVKKDAKVTAKESQCVCPEEDTDGSGKGCKVPRFSSALIRETIYQSLTGDQQIKLHIDIANFLEPDSPYLLFCSYCLQEHEKSLSKIDNSKRKKSIYDSSDPMRSVTLNLRFCTCFQTKPDTFYQIGWHFLQSEFKVKSIYYMLLGSEAALRGGNFETADSYLTEARQTVELLVKDHSTYRSDNENDMKLPINIVNIWIQRLVAQILILKNESEEAIDILKKALLILHCKYPQFYKKLNPKKYILRSVAKRQKKEILEEARCLIHLSRALGQMEDFSSALRIARYAQEACTASEAPFNELIEAYALVLEYSSVLQVPQKKQFEMEDAAIELCENRLDPELDSNILYGIVYLLHKILSIHLNDGVLDRAIEIGFKAHHICQSVFDARNLLEILPLLAQALIHQNNPTKCLEVLTHIRNKGEETNDNKAMAFYYAELAELIMHEKFHLLGDHLEECREFVFQQCEEDTLTEVRGETKYYLNVTMALWCLQFGLGEEYIRDTWYTRAVNSRIENPTTYWSISASISFVEIELEKLRPRYLEPLSELRSEKKKIIKMLKAAEILASTQHYILLPRILHIDNELRSLWEHMKFLA